MKVMNGFNHYSHGVSFDVSLRKNSNYLNIIDITQLGVIWTEGLSYNFFFHRLQGCGLGVGSPVQREILRRDLTIIFHCLSFLFVCLFNFSYRIYFI